MIAEEFEEKLSRGESAEEDIKNDLLRLIEKHGKDTNTVARQLEKIVIANSIREYIRNMRHW